MVYLLRFVTNWNIFLSFNHCIYYLFSCIEPASRVLQEERSLGILIFHLFHSLVLRLTKIPESRRNLNDFFSVATLSEWEYSFAVEICSQYSCQIWFPCLVKLFKLGAHNEEEFLFQLHLIMQFTLLKLQDPKLLFDLEAMEDVGYLQVHFIVHLCI